MASDPAYAATPVVWSGLVPATLDTSLTAPSNVTTLGTAGNSGCKIDEIVFQAVGNTADGVINVFLYDGSTYHLIDQVICKSVTSSTTLGAWRAIRRYENLVLPSNSWSLRVAVTVSGLQSLIKVTATGGNI